MALLLSIETSTSACSAALHEGGKLLGNTELLIPQAASSGLTPLIEQLMIRCGCQLTELSAVAVAKGPGSYTGLRIGVATAKGLCFALDKPLIGVPTLEAMTHGLQSYFPKPEYYFCPMIDARRMEVYCAVYDETGQEVLPADARIIDLDSFGDLLAKHQIVFFGDGAAKCRDVLSHSPHAHFLADFYPSANYMGKLAYDKFRQMQFEDVVHFEPFYLKEFFYKQPTNAK